MQVGDLVRWNPQFFEWGSDQSEYSYEVGLIIGFETNYDRFGDPEGQCIIINWGANGVTSEFGYTDMLEVINK